MATTDKHEAPRATGQGPDGQSNAPTGEENRRQFLKAGLAFAVVLVIAGVVAVAGSLFSPPNPPQAQEALPPAPAQTTTVTATETETETVVSQSGLSTSESASTTSSSTTSTTETSSSTSSPFPRYLVTNISGVSEAQPIFFNYPLEETPSVLVKLGVQGAGGVGPDNDIVAFSQVCQHLGCDVDPLAKGGAPACDSSYSAPGPEAYCCCHGTVYDLTQGAKVISGPAPRPLPQVTLEFDSSTGNIYAVGMGPPTIFGYHTGSDDVLYDLQGGTPVS